MDKWFWHAEVSICIERIRYVYCPWGDGAYERGDERMSCMVYTGEKPDCNVSCGELLDGDGGGDHGSMAVMPCQCWVCRRSLL